MQESTPDPFQNLRSQIPISPPTAPNDEKDSDRDVNQDAANGAISEPNTKKLSALERLDALASFKIDPTELGITLTESLGAGGKAEVIKARFKRGGESEEQDVAVKKLRYDDDMDKRKFSNEFANEVQMMAGLKHENIINLIGFVEDLENGKGWIVMSWEPNGNVREFVASAEWEIPERISLIMDTFRGIKYLHTREPPICHGDIKSLNILVSSSYRAIITDFGSARVVSETCGGATSQDETLSVSVGSTEDESVGRSKVTIVATGNQLTVTGPAWSLRWVAPEVVMGERQSLASDIWAAGWVCWEIMTNKVPFPELTAEGAITLKVVKGEVPIAREDTQLSQVIRLCSLMTDCWAFYPGDRPDIVKCYGEVRWMPAFPPSGSKTPSFDLLYKMGYMHYSQNSYEKATSLFEQALAAARSTSNQRASAMALEWLGHVYRAQWRHKLAVESYTQAQEIYAQIGDRNGQANMLRGLAIVYRFQSDDSRAEEYFKRAKDEFTRTGNDLGLANTLRGLGHLYVDNNRASEAIESYTTAQAIHTRIGDDRGQANTLQGLGNVYYAQSQYTQAKESYTMARDLYARIGNDMGRANTLDGLGNVHLLRSEYTDAEKFYTQAQLIYTRLGDKQGRANTILHLGHLRRNQGRNAEAAVLYENAIDLYAQIDNHSGQKNASRSLAALSE